MPLYHAKNLRLFTRLFSILLMGLLLSVVSGCGKKGPLYIPDDSKPTASPTAQENASDSTTTQDTP